MRPTGIRLSARLTALLLLLPISLIAGTPAYPLKKSADNRYLVDQNNVPFLIVGDSPQALIVNISESDAASFFADRAGLGFNTLWINLLCDEYTGGPADGSTIDNVKPFTATISPGGVYDLATPNETYFAHVDRVLNLAAAQGLQVLLDPIETGGWLDTMLGNGEAKCRAYGQYLGNRYKGFTNILWMSGNDFQQWQVPTNDTVALAVALGIRDRDTNHLHTIELDYYVSSSLNDPNWAPVIGLNATYTYYPTYAQCLLDYNRTNFDPNFMVEANYEFEHAYTGNLTLRRQEYWAALSGTTGQLYGNGYTWPFVSGWQDHLDTPGAIQFGYVSALLSPRAWYHLIPDTNHVVVTAGFGTFSDSGSVNDNDYATAARTADGSVVMAYMPTARTLTVDMSRLAGPAVAHWYDPAAGSYAAIAGSPLTNSGTRTFNPPGANFDGDSDWVLILETNPPPIPPPPPPPPPRPAFVQQNYATPQTAQLAVSVAYGIAQTAGSANIVAIGWNDATNNVTSVGDSAGNTYQVAVPTFRGNGMSQAIYYAIGINGGTNTIMVTFDHPAAFVDLRAAEYSGLSTINTFDAGSSATGVSGNGDSGPVSILATNELLFGAGMTAGGFSSAGSGFSQRVITVPDSDIVEDEVAATVGVYHATASLGSNTWLMQLAAFRPAVIVSPPALNVSLTSSNTLALSWPVGGPSFGLQQNSDLAATSWTTVTNAVQSTVGTNVITVPLSPSSRFFRLKYP